MAEKLPPTKKRQVPTKEEKAEELPPTKKQKVPRTKEREETAASAAARSRAEDAAMACSAKLPPTKKQKVPRTKEREETAASAAARSRGKDATMACSAKQKHPEDRSEAEIAAIHRDTANLNHYLKVWDRHFSRSGSI